MLFIAHVFALSVGAWSVFGERSEMMEFLFLNWILDHLSSDNTLSATPKQMGLPHTSDEDCMEVFEDYREVFESLADPSFNCNGQLPKLARCGVGGGALLV